MTTTTTPMTSGRSLAGVRRVAGKRARRFAEIAELDTELRRFVVAAFEEGVPGSVIAEAAGVSIPRVYQIRDGRRGPKVAAS